MSVCSRLRALDTGAVSDALDRLSLKGAVLGIRSLTGPVQIAGRVVTVRLVAAGSTVNERHLCTAAVEAAEPGDLIVVEHHDRDDCAGWGGILSVAAQKKGLSGTIVDGLARDIDESIDEAYPVFARGGTPTTARGRIVEQAWGVTISVGGIRVDSGDFAIADSSGVVFVPASKIEATLHEAEAIASRERAMAAAVRRGVPVGDVMGSDYESMLEGNEDD